jgi:hypothetical protein
VHTIQKLKSLGHGKILHHGIAISIVNIFFYMIAFYGNDANIANYRPAQRSSVGKGVVFAEHGVEAQRRLATSNRGARDDELSNRLFVRRLVVGCVLDLELDTAERNAKVAVLVRRCRAAPVVVDVGLCDSSGNLASCQSIDDTCLCVDAQIREIVRAQRRCVQPSSLRHKQKTKLSGRSTNGCSCGRIDAADERVGGQSARGQATRFEVVCELLQATGS